jgi:hypothetical protein
MTVPQKQKAAYGEAARFLKEVVLPHTGDQCLAWPFSRYPNGYGQLWRDGKPAPVSRIVCTEINGPPPTEKHEAAHSCGKGHEGCCNPRHLDWKTPAENCSDKLTHGTHFRGDQSPNAKLTREKVQRIKELRGTVSRRKLAEWMGVSEPLIGHIHSGRRWGWLEAVLPKAEGHKGKGNE